jgi:CBS domain-containing membrane protein
MGASAVLLFVLPASPLAQPWSLLGGNLVSGLIGVSCARLIGDPILAAAIAVSLAIAAMFALRCLHPPSGAIAMTAVMGGPAIHAMGYDYVLFPVALNSLLLLATAVFFNNATGRRYPHKLAPLAAAVSTPAVPTLPAHNNISAEDLDTVLARYKQVIDISRDDLEQILRDTEQQATLRHLGTLTCAQAMSRDLISVEFGTSLQDAWDLLHQHRCHAIPVIDGDRHVIGMLRQAHFIEHAQLAKVQGLTKKLQQLYRPSAHLHIEKAEVVGQIMSQDVSIATENQPILECVAGMSIAGVQTMVVVDDARRLVGLLTQADMIAALYSSPQSH